MDYGFAGFFTPKRYQSISLYLATFDMYISPLDTVKGAIMALTALEVSKSKAADKPQRLADGGNMYLLIQPNGAKYWRLDYRLAGKRKTLAIGVYPDIGLAVCAALTFCI